MSWLYFTDRDLGKKFPAILVAVKQHGVALLVVIGHAPFPELAGNFVNTIGRIDAYVATHKPPFIA